MDCSPEGERENHGVWLRYLAKRVGFGAPEAIPASPPVMPNPGNPRRPLALPLGCGDNGGSSACGDGPALGFDLFFGSVLNY